MTQPGPSKSQPESLSGAFFAAAAFLIWGLSPVYWKALGTVAPLQITMHRVLWSFFFLVPLLVVRRRWQEFTAALKRPRHLLVLCATAGLVGANWLLYIWAVNNNYLLQASLGYYINPLVNVVLGMIFLRERLRRLQIVAVLLAAGGVSILTVHYGRIPWIALTLAVTFGFYGLIRKVAPVSAPVGLAVETFLLSFPALGGLLYLQSTGRGAIFSGNTATDILLMCTALVTAPPLLFFTLGARRLNLSTLGLMQYIAPSGMFLLAVLFYHEPFAVIQVWTFLMIWTALGIYSTDSLIYYRQKKPS